jgi:hypothetical protein
VRDFGDQPAAAQARSRLAALRLAGGPTLAPTMRQRKLPRDSFSDGQRAMHYDDATNTLRIGDLAGKEKPVIFKPKAGDQIAGAMPSRDISMVAMDLASPDGTYKVAVIKADGTGYREIGASTCDHSWSWDNRYIFVCSDDPDGTRYLVRVPVAGGEIRKVRAIIAQVNRVSPDGRFIAFGNHQFDGFGKVQVMPSEGGEPQLVFDSAKLIDWTRDGRYLILDSARFGSPALYLLPLNDGRAVGNPVFVHYGTCWYGITNLNGSMSCIAAPPGGLREVWLGALDSRGHPAEWKRLSFSGGAGCAVNGAFAWSPDSTRIYYSCNDPAAGQDSWMVRVRNIASGEEREVYRSRSPMACMWAAQRPNLFCVWRDPQPATALLSISIDSGRVERLGTLPGTDRLWSPFFGSADDRVIYLGQEPENELVRWDIGTQQATTVERITGLTLPGFVIPEPNAHWIGRRNKETTEIRPFSGGDWRPLISLSPTHIAFTPDGNWLLYHDVDAAGKDALFRIATAGGRPERIGIFPSAAKYAAVMKISPDGQKILAAHDANSEFWLLENFEPKQPVAR